MADAVDAAVEVVVACGSTSRRGGCCFPDFAVAVLRVVAVADVIIGVDYPLALVASMAAVYDQDCREPDAELEKFRRRERTPAPSFRSRKKLAVVMIMMMMRWG